MKIKIIFWEIFLLIFIALAVTISFYFLWPPHSAEDQEQYFGYLDEEFDGLPELIYFKPRIDSNNQNINNSIVAQESMQAELRIEKLNIQAPIVFNVNAQSNAEYLQALENGVVHFTGTALPNAENGNTFIFGHSSYYYNSPGNYKNVFADLGKISLNDEIMIKRTDKEENYFFYVSDIQVVEANFTDAFNQAGDKRLTLMTCWPVGTSNQRLIVTAKPR